ncbi:MAG: SDR family NAD(P)-dependent oxidoreductase [Pseudomonadota bacterium]
MNTSNIISENRVAVITGGADGIGLAAAHRFAEVGMTVCLADINEEKLREAAENLPGDNLFLTTDVDDFNAVESLKNKVLDAFGRIDFLFINAGQGIKTGSWQNLSAWQQTIQTNLWGVINCIHAFMPHMIQQSHPSLVVTTGSKQGITTPPGNPAYNVSKAAVKTTAEALEHAIRNEPNYRVKSHFLIPGFTFTGMVNSASKPASAWTPDQVIDFMLESIERDDFYIFCPDNDVDRSKDNKRIQWALGDMIHNRPPLSRWHADYQDAFAAEMKES